MITKEEIDQHVRVMEMGDVPGPYMLIIPHDAEIGDLGDGYTPDFLPQYHVMTDHPFGYRKLLSKGWYYNLHIVQSIANINK